MAAASFKIIGIIGGIGSGKSAVARGVAARTGMELVDADQLGHAVLREPAVIAALRAVWGEDVVDAAGQLNRPAIAAKVFGTSAAAQASRQQLEQVVHPRIQERMHAAVAAARSAEPAKPGVVIDAAILLEAGWKPLCDRVVFIDVPRPVRLERVQQQRGWDDAQLAAREASQWPLDRKRQAADIVVANTTTLEAAVDQVLATLSNDS